MCKFNHDMPLGQVDPASATGGMPLDPGMSGPPSPTGPWNPPASASVNTPTKFGKLMKVVLPLAAGAGIGATGGNWRVPGSGGQAAQNFFAQQAAQRMQQQDLALRRQQDTTLNQQRMAQTAEDQARTASIERGNNKTETRIENVGGKAHDVRYTFDANGNHVS